MTQDMNHIFRKALRAVFVATMMSLAGSHALAQVTINGSVYGGGNLADVGGSVTVNMTAGTVGNDVYGGGALANTNTNNWNAEGEGYELVSGLTVGTSVVTGLYTKSGESYTEITAANKTAEANTDYYKKVGTWAEGMYNSSTGATANITTVNLTGGTIKGDAYGGGLGQLGNDPVAATVYGNISVTLGGSGEGSSATAFNISYFDGDHSDVVKSGRVFGCNNLNGSPKGNVTVTVNKTVRRNAQGELQSKPQRNTQTYEVAAVYGGGNLANFVTNGKKTHVIINGCDETSINYVYGGGNAAAVPETDVDINAAYEIEYVFGGGNGKDEYKLDGSGWQTNPGANVNGNANTMLYGGTIHEAFGGSNEKGTISGSVYINTDTNDDCDLDVDKLYGAGKNADIEGDLIIVLGCKTKRTEEVYGGAENANVKGNVELTITSGEFGKVFGGNNQSGAIFGHIKLNIEETGCTPIIIDELYLGGNQAAYSVYGYYKGQYYQNEGNYYLDAAHEIPLYQDNDGNLYLDAAKNKRLYKKDGETYLYLDGEYQKPLYRPRTSASDGTAVFFGNGGENDHTKAPYDDPELNIISCTRIGKVFGGGLGEGAVIYGSPTVNINQIFGKQADANNPGSYIAATELGQIGVNANGTTTDCGVFGGGNQAKVVGNTTVNIGTKTTVDLHQSVNASGVYTLLQNQTVLGAKILSNVYGGGNLADVTGNTNVNICAKYNTTSEKWDGVTPGTAGVSIAGNVYGGGKGVARESGEGAFFCAEAMVGEEGTNSATNNISSTYADYGTHVRIGNGTVGTLENGTLREGTGNVYGGGEIGRVEFHTDVTIGFGAGTGSTTKSPVIYGSVFGAGKGTNTHGYSGLVRGDSKVAIQGDAKVGHSVYGGGEMASVGKYDVVNGLPKTPVFGGKCTVTIQGYAEIGPNNMQMTKTGGPDDTGHVFGAGKGILPYENVIGTPWSMQPTGKVTYDENNYVVGEDGLNYEAAYYKFIQSLGLASNTDVTIGGHAFIKGSVYGGSENGYVQTNTYVTIASGQIGVGQNRTTPYADNDFIDPSTTTVTTENALATCATWTYDKETTGKPYDKYATHLNPADNEYYYDDGYTKSSMGGASVATDGHTYYGNVFGGGRGVVPFAAGKWHRAAGSVGGSTRVDITDGHILSSVYGGNENTDVGSYALGSDGEPTTNLTSGGNCIINMSGGTVGVPRTKEQIDNNPVIGNVFGAGKGDKRVLFNTWTNVGATSVNISGTAKIYGSVFGGGEDGHVINNAVTNIGGTVTTGVVGNTTDHAYSKVVIGSTGISGADGNVFGGGRGSETALTAGVVGGNVNLTVDNGYILGNVYGGGRLASVGTNFTNPTLENGDPDPRYGQLQTPNADHGNIIVTVNDGTIGSSNSTGVNGNIYGGSKGTTTDFRLGIVRSTTINMTDGTAYASVYGGGELAQVVGYHTTSGQNLGTEINISGGTIGISGKGREIWGNVYGGGKGNETDVVAGLIKTNTKVSIGQAENKTTQIYHNIYGGGALGSVGTFDLATDADPQAATYYTKHYVKAGTPISWTNGTGTATVEITGGTIGSNGNNNGMVNGSSRGLEGDPARTNADQLAWVRNTSVIIGTSGVTSDTSPYITGSVYGGGENGHNSGDAEVVIHSGYIGYKSHTSESDYSCGNVYGAGCGTDKYRDTDEKWHYNPFAGIVRGTTKVTVDGGTVHNNVYGAGSMASVGTITSETPHNTSDYIVGTGTDEKNYGFGLSWPYEFTYSATTGETEVNIKGNENVNAHIKGHVFGAAMGAVDVNESDITKQRYEEAKYANVRKAYVKIGETGSPTIDGSVYGGGEDGHVNEDAFVTIDGGTIAHSVFGGGKGTSTYKTTLLDIAHEGVSKDAPENVHSWTAGKVYGNTTITMNGGSVGYSIYGGGNMASVGKGNYAGGSDDYSTVGYGELPPSNALALWSNTNFTGSGLATVNIYGGTVGAANTTYEGLPTGNIFGSSRGVAALSCSYSPRYKYVPDFFLGYVNETIVNVGDATNTTEGYNGPRIYGSVYGGGENGHVRRNTQVAINKGTIGVENDATANKLDRGNVYGAGSGVGKNSAGAYNTSSGSVTCTTTVTVNGGTIYQNVYGGGAQGSVGPPPGGITADETNSESSVHKTYTKVIINGGNIGSTNNAADYGGNIYGASRGNASLNAAVYSTDVWSTVNVTNGIINGSVFGGGENGIVKCGVDVNVTGGTIAKDVYGGGALADTQTSNWDATNNTWATGMVDANGKTTYKTNVNLLGGFINGDAYGGGLGQKDGFNGKSGDIAAQVYGDVNVKLGSESGSFATSFMTSYYTGDHANVVKSGRIFGCNNLMGSPRGNVTVDVWKTVAGKDGTDATINRTPEAKKKLKEGDEGYVAHTYEVSAVYGGGNLADFTTAGKTAKVIIETCDVSIQSVYGGGNAAEVPGTDVLIKGAYEIDEVFGGGNGKDPYTNGSTWITNSGANIGNSTNPGNANTLMTGGLIHAAYGGSNEKGTIFGNVQIDVGPGDNDPNHCVLDVEKMVGAGKNADVNGNLIMILGCKPSDKIPVLYAGADQANVNGNVELTITSGNYGEIFGGNNLSGAIRGHIKLNIEETGNCDTPITIDNLYLGGNQAAYSVYGYYVKTTTSEGDNATGVGAKTETAVLTNGKLTFMPRQSNLDPHLPVKSYSFNESLDKWEWEVYDGTEGNTFTPYVQPKLNIISCTYIGNVFGGGYGTGATMYADPTVNINMIPGDFANDNDVGVPAVMDAKGLTTSENSNNLGIIGNVYGGGNAADVIGDPTVNIGTASTVDLVSTGATGVSVVGAYIIGNVYGGGMGSEDTFLCEKAMIGVDGAGARDADGDGKLDTEGGTTVNIYKGLVRGNVYGGGQIGRVEKNTVVTIGDGTNDGAGTENGTPTPVIRGSVFGGGKGEKEHGYAALVRGNPTVTIQGNAKVLHSVYGGGEIASVARYNVPKTEAQVQAAIAAGYKEAKLGMPYALKDPNSGTCTVIVRGYAEIGPDGMQMTKTGGPDDTGYVFGAGKGILPGGDYEFELGTTRRMVLYDAGVHTTVGQEGSKWQWVDPDHSDTNKNVWEYFATLDEYIAFIQTLALSSRTYVTITDNAFVKGSVYGGSENGIVQFDTDVKIQSGQIGCGEGETGAHPDAYWTSNSEDPTKFAECASWLFKDPYAPYDPYAKYKKTVNGKDRYYYNEDCTEAYYAEGGAVNASDGHTFYGNVFGGGSGSVPYFDHTLRRSVYLHSAGQVKGNTNVTISGGHILTNVYGGCEATNVGETANVTMTGGTIGVPRTDDQIIAHPLTGYLFGGGKGDQRIFFNKDTNVKDAVVKVEGGRIYGSVYGGGEDGHVLRNVTLTIGKQTTTTGENNETVTTTSGPKIGTKGTSYYDGHVFGGGRGFGGDALTAGNVGGSVDLNILDGEILGSVYGGGRLASVGYGLYLVDEEVTIAGETVKPYGTMRPDDVYDDPSKPTSTEDAEDFFTKGRGHINITISGGTIGNGDEYAYDANNQLSHTKGGNVFAGGMGRLFKLDNTTPISSLDWWKLGNVKSTKLTISGNAKIKSCVYGGGELGMVQGGNHTSADSKTVSTEIIINGGTIGTEVTEKVNNVDVTQYTFGSVFGGGYGSLTEKLDHSGSTNPTYSTYKYTYPKYIAGRVKGSTEVTMTDGTVLASVYGGGEMAAVGESKELSTSTVPVVLGETLTGNNGAPILANTYVTISGGTIGKEKVGTTYFGGAKMGNVYGGGSGDNNTVRSGHIYGNTNVTITGESTRIYHNVYGGGAYGTVGDFTYTTRTESGVQKVSGITGLHTERTNTGTANVTITGGTIGYDGKENGMVFGSSRGDINEPGARDDYTAWVYNANVTIGTSGTPASGSVEGGDYVAAVPPSGPEIKGSVYGSGENGHTFNNTVVTMNAGKIGIDDENDDGYSVTSNGKTYEGAEYPYRGNVYGGGCGTDKYYSDHSLENHSGGGDTFNALAGIVYGNATVNINGGTVVRNVYGAGAMGSVGKTVSTTSEGATTTTITGGVTTINVSGGTIGVDGTAYDGNVFGAARGDVDAISNKCALVRKETSVSVTGGIINGNVYGGGELGCVGEYTISSDYRTFTWQDTDGVTNTDNNTKNTGICNVEIDGSSAVINGNVFGAGKGKDDTFWCEKGIAYSTNVSIKNGTVNRNVYGGGEVGRVETDTEVKVGLEPEEGGAESKPTINGSVFGGGAGVETHGYSALVRGNTRVTVDQKAHVTHSVYGGGEIASVGRYALDSNKMPSILQGGGYCYITIQGRATIGDDVFGAGKGVTPHFDKTNDDLSKRSRRMSLKDGWESLEGENRFKWDYLERESDYSTYLETLALATHPEVTIDGNASISGSVFGGGELGLTKGSVIVNIQGGTITEDVYGGGSLANTNTTSSVDTNGDGVADKTVDPTTTVNLKGGTINRNVYGGGLGQLAKDAEPEVLYTVDDEEVIAGTKEVDDVKTPAVAAVDPVEAKVNGDVLVKLNEPTTSEGTPTYGNCVVKGTIFGCNNLNGSPQKNVTVHVYKTVGYGEGHQKKYKNEVVNGQTQVVPDKDNTSFDLKAVYGGGNVATYCPDDPAARATATANVIIDGCDLTSIETVYGGGNAAAAPATHIEVNSCYEIGTVFGGGNGKDALDDGSENPGADVGYKINSEGTDKESYGTGVALAELRGGTIHKAFGGSNTKGNVRTSATVDLNEPDPNDCPLRIEEVYGAGNEADQDGTSNINLGCISFLSEIYGGAKKADVNNNIELTIQSGRFNRVFGGNNLGGNISGTITVNIEETGCHPIVIGQLFGGGNQAAYSAPSGQHGPTVNVKSFTSIGEIYGGGFGNTAIVTGDTYVNINESKGKYADRTATVDFTDQNGVDVYENSDRVKVSEDTGKWIHFVVGKNQDDSDKYSTVWQPEHREGAIGTIGNVFGGGNEAGVNGNTNINIGDMEYVEITTNIVAGETDVRDCYIRTGEGTEGSPYVYSEVSVKAVANTPYYRLVIGEGDTETYEAINAADIAVGTTDVSNYYTRSGEEGHYVYHKVSTAQANTTYCKKVLGVNITGNVYGGGNAADVTGDTNVFIGQ